MLRLPELMNYEYTVYTFPLGYMITFIFKIFLYVSNLKRMFSASSVNLC
jgi:hypothetical protein